MRSVRYKKNGIIFFLALFLMSILPYGTATGTETDTTDSEKYDALFQKAADEGSVKVIVKLAVPGIEEKTEASRSFRSVSPGQVFSSDAVRADQVLAQAIEATSGSIVQGLAGTPIPGEPHLYDGPLFGNGCVIGGLVRIAGHACRFKCG